NFPFFALGALSTYGVAREFDAGPKEALASAVAVVLSPPLFAYLTTNYVDVQVFAAEMTGTLFLIRYVKERHAKTASLPSPRSVSRPAQRLLGWSVWDSQVPSFSVSWSQIAASRCFGALV
ncbi:MAG: hypothetical protein C4346_18975, partial [Chloroflexota bacterium]